MSDFSQLSISDTLFEFICENFPQTKKKELKITDQLLIEGIVDSMGLLTIISFIEETFSILVDDDDVVIENFGSIATLTSYIERCLEQAK